ncbi:uncharacterized mitochondrial protein AtMg00810-like [Malus domestica]|uniref:uncharacterized mitochondrial protein AtMg00810-like n=1 Tax=Malus domestica TaxID=3750 RepID=UPI003974DBF9
MKVKMEALEKNYTWDLVPLPNGKKAVGCRWVFTIKHKANGSIDRYKARLVAKGYTQTYGVDYQETFAPVVKLNIVRVLLSLAANHDWPLLQFDVKKAFLHGDLKEEVYMDLSLMAPNRGLVFSKNGNLNVEWYTDADWAGSITDRRSTSGYFTFVGGNLVTWRSTKQKVVARSSAKAEFRVMSHGVCELLWLKKLLRDLGFKPKGVMKLHYDNKAVIEIAHNPVQHD